VVYFSTATNRRLRGVLWSIIAPPFISFVITGISRALSHQIVRHRVGFAFSQLSQQYHDESDAEFAMPAEIEGNPRAEAVWERAVSTAKEAYSEILQLLDQ
jgi:thymidylate synthase (FAD)